MAAAVAMGLAKMRSPLREDQVGRNAQGPPFVAFGDEGEEDLGLLGALGQVSQVIEEEEVEVVQLAQPAWQVQVALGGEEFLHQAVSWGEEDGVASFHQAVAQGTEGVGLAGAGQSEGQDIDAALYEAALGQAIQLLSPGQGQTVMLEGLPGLARGQPGLPAKPGDATMAAVLRFLFQGPRGKWSGRRRGRRQ